ncbi:MAG: DUF3109 family protein [Bacteroidota bacterium]
MVCIDGVTLDEELGTDFFLCDIPQCRGACCWLKGGRGAPLAESEAEEIRRVYPRAEPYMSPRGLEAVRRQGLAAGPPGDLSTPTVGDMECAFAFFREGAAFCALERAWEENRSGWRKPLSCHLFPLRVTGPGGSRLLYERIPECGPGRERGAREGMPLLAFAGPALLRAYGETWCERLSAHQAMQGGAS